jgi:hypothetical protein
MNLQIGDVLYYESLNRRIVVEEVERVGRTHLFAARGPALNRDLTPKGKGKEHNFIFTEDQFKKRYKVLRRGSLACG